MSADPNPMTGTVAIFEEPGQPLRVVTRRVPRDLAIGEILVRITHCTICGSDLHTCSGRRSAPGACVLGHETIGEVVDWAGPQPTDFNGNKLEVGSRITWMIAVPCDDCFYCRHQLEQKCERLFKYGHEAFDESYGATGGLADYCRLRPNTVTFRVPDQLPSAIACPANCATATVVASIRLVEDLGPVTGQTAIVSGVGMLGLTACAMLHTKGVRQIVAIDVCAARLDLAKRFGATHVIPADATDFGDQLAAITDGRGADFALEYAGPSAAVAALLDRIRIGGIIVLAGSVFPGAPITIEPEQIVRRLLTIRGIHNYRPDDLATALEFLDRNCSSYPFAQIVSQPFPLHAAQQAFEYAATGAAIRVLVSSGGSSNEDKNV